MQAWPVMWRELCGESRRPFTYWLRVLGASALLLAFFKAGLTMGFFHGLRANAPGLPWDDAISSPSAQGTVLFGWLNSAVFVAIWMLVPLITADAISRERREGTLPLLFLTPLGALSLVVGKSFAQILRALTLWLTMLPWLMMPVILGGVEWKDVLTAVAVSASSLILALTAGLTASCLAKDQVRVFFLAEVLAALFAMLLMASVGWAWSDARAVGLFPSASFASSQASYRAWRLAERSSSWSEAPLTKLTQLFDLTTSQSPRVELHSNWMYFSNPYAEFTTSTQWNDLWSNFPSRAHWVWFTRLLFCLLASVGMFLGLLFLASWQVHRSWRDQPATIRQQELHRALFAQRFLTLVFERSMRRKLDRNPIGWLEQHSAQARLVKWCWCLVILLLEVALTPSANDLYAGQTAVGVLVLLGLAFSAAGSFRYERQSGALELLLVTPLRASQVINGRLRGLCLQFLPTIGVFLVANLYLYFPRWDDRQLVSTLALLAGPAVALPVVGLYCSLQQIGFLTAWLWSCFTTLIAPWIIVRLAFGLGGLSYLVPDVLGRHGRGALSSFACAVLFMQLGLAAWAWQILNRQLSERRFVLRPGG